MSTGIREVSTLEFENEVVKSDIPVIVDFWAPWCGPCRMVAPEIEKIAAEHSGRAKVVKVNVDENQELAVRYGVMSIPTVARFDSGRVVAQVVGARSASDMARQLGLG